MLRLILFIFFCLLAAACSQVASGTADDDEAEALSSELDENRNGSSVESHSGEMSSGGKSSSSEGSKALESSESNEYRSSSSFNELSSSSEEIAVYSSSSGFYFADVEWTFAEWEYDSLYRSEYFASAKYMEPLENQFEITENLFYLLSVNKFYTSADNGGFYLKKNNSSSGCVVSFDKPKEKRLLLGVVMAHFDYVDGECVGSDYNVNRVVEPIEKNGRLFYPLDSVLLDSMDGWSYVQLYNEDFSPYEESLTSVFIADESLKTFSLDFNVNLIVAGKYMGTSDDVPVDELAIIIKDRMNLALNPGGISVRNVELLYAENHPVVGEKFPSTQEIVIPMSSPRGDIDSLGRWPGHDGSINLVLGAYIYDEENTSVGGFSPYAGQIYYEEIEKSGSYIVIGARDRISNEKYSSTVIANIALHELGHFLGLKHTTEYGGEEFDKLEDTPECPGMVKDGPGYDLCPDRHYIMFPQGGFGWEYKTFSPQQMDAIRFYLSVTPHK